MTILCRFLSQIVTGSVRQRKSRLGYTTAMTRREDVAIIAIGRNEGERLKSCLCTVLPAARTVIYVDSGSGDGTPEYAAQVGAQVVELDTSQPMSAARGRNEGFAYLQKVDPQVPYVQFLDGDCDLSDGWLEAGVAALEEHQDVAVVCGQVRELFPEATIYNLLADQQWQQPAGIVQFTGGRFLMRKDVFNDAGGFRADVIAGEDHDFSIRVRQLGWKLLQLDREMACHDMAMTRFSEYWKRSVRTGHSYAHVAALHGSKEDAFARDMRRIYIWALAVPMIALCLAPFTRGISLLALACLYAAQFLHNYLRGRRLGWSRRSSSISAWFNFVYKFPALLGIFQFRWRQWRGESFRIIEYRRS